jgi:uncharacterized protein (TIGR03083 family)
MSTQAELVKVVQTESERLQQYLAALPEDAWTKPSACALWEVRDVVAHLITGANFYTDCITRGLQEDTSTPEGRPEPSSFHTVSQEERQRMATAAAQRDIALRERLGQELLDVFCQTGDHFNHLVASLSPQEWDTPCYHGRGTRSLVSEMVFERAIHGWDIRSALEPSAHLSPEALTVMPDLVAACLHWLFLPGARLPTPIRYRFAFTGTRNSPWDMVVEGDTAHMAPATDATPANATFSCEIETFALLMCGRIGFDAALGDKRVIPTGDMAVVQAFKKWLWFQRVQSAKSMVSQRLGTDCLQPSLVARCGLSLCSCWELLLLDRDHIQGRAIA